MIALRVAYDGTSFSGSQRQPNVKTVEGVLLEALQETNIIPKDYDLLFRMASRTDKGVSARENILFFECDKKTLLHHNALSRITDRLPAIWITGYASADYLPPFEKEYRYYLDNKAYSQDLLEALCKLFTGEHDFSNFSKFNPGKDTARSIFVSANYMEFGWALSFVGTGFLWQMCRRIATAFRYVINNSLTLGEVEEMLIRPQSRKLPPSPAENLLLYKIDVPFHFTDFPYAINKMKNFYKEKIRMAKLSINMGIDANF
ncbi:MAG: pseudouridine synthase family protein [Candidatus Methanofastidiosia archaeon]